MPIESSQNVTGARPLGAIDARIVRTGAELKDQAAGTTPASTTPTPAASATYQPSEALDPGSAPVDTQRVQVIRHAIETGSYPVIPTKIADAMIAAGLLLRAQA
jgi:negative regulator of flagellin synthesis FlgM